MIKTIIAKVRSNEHANLDSFPFRYGFSFDMNKSIELTNVRNEKADKDYRDRYHIDADFINPRSNKFEKCHFVLIRSTNKVVTLWGFGKSNQAEYVLSETIRTARELNKISVNDLISMHDQGLKTHYEFSEYLATKLSQEEVEKIKEATSLRIKNMSDALKKLADDRDNERKRADKFENKFNLKDEELENYKLEQSRATRSRKDLTLGSEKLLVKVKTDVMHYGSLCTELVLDNADSLYMKTSVFDPDLSITNKAKTLEGKRIKTTCWDPVGNPGHYEKMGYFRNIYEVK